MCVFGSFRLLIRCVFVLVVIFAHRGLSAAKTNLNLFIQGNFQAFRDSNYCFFFLLLFVLGGVALDFWCRTDTMSVRWIEFQSLRMIGNKSTKMNPIEIEYDNLNQYFVHSNSKRFDFIETVQPSRWNRLGSNSNKMGFPLIGLGRRNFKLFWSARMRDSCVLVKQLVRRERKTLNEWVPKRRWSSPTSRKRARSRSNDLIHSSMIYFFADRFFFFFFWAHWRKVQTVWENGREEAARWARWEKAENSI